MEVQDLLANVSYVTDQRGKRQAVMLNLDIWDALLVQLQNNESAPALSSASHQEMAREEKAYQALHPELLKKYAGQHVAIYQGQLVDHDASAEALYVRIRRAYPKAFVLITPVLATAEEEYVVRSPGSYEFFGVRVAGDKQGQTILGRNVLNETIVTLNGLANVVMVER